MAQKGKTFFIVLSVLALIVVIVGGAITIADRFMPGKLSLSDGGVSSGKLDELATASLSTCPTDGDSSVIFDVANYVNDTSAETFDVTAYIRNLESGAVVTITDTTNPSATTLNCGEKHRVEIVGTGGNDSDNGRVERVLIGGNSASINPDGTVDFLPTKANYALRLGVSQQGNLEFRAYDKNNAGFMCNGDDVCNDYEVEGVSFTSTTNGTAMAIGSGGNIYAAIEARNLLSDGDFNDYYTLIAVEAPKTTWKDPVVTVDGVTLSDIKSMSVTQEQLEADPSALGLTAEENNALTNYEFVYKIDKALLDGGDKWDVEFYLEAKSGQNPSTDVEMDFVTATRYLSSNGVDTKIGAYDDTTSNTVVKYVNDVTIDIS